jgi:transposase
MTRATRDAEYTGTTTPCLYLAFELGIDEWKLGFTTEAGATPRVRTMSARDLQRLAREIVDAKKSFGLSATTARRSCYEAGRDGFWLHRHLTSIGIENAGVDSSSLEVNRRRRRAKSDGLDVRKLLSMLLRFHAGARDVWSVVRVPSLEEEDRRQLHRELRTLKKEYTRVTNRVKGLLANQGIRPPKGTDVGTARETLRRWDGSPLPAMLRRGGSGNGSTRNSCARRSSRWNASAGARSQMARAKPSTRSGSCSACGRSGRAARGSL